LSEMSWEAVRVRERGDLAEAMRLYRAILDVFPDDPVAKFMLKAGES